MDFDTFILIVIAFVLIRSALLGWSRMIEEEAARRIDAEARRRAEAAGNRDG